MAKVFCLNLKPQKNKHQKPNKKDKKDKIKRPQAYEIKQQMQIETFLQNRKALTLLQLTSIMFNSHVYFDDKFINNNRVYSLLMDALGLDLYRESESLTKFKGYKIEAKNIRRNMMLKLKNPRKNLQSSISLHSPKQQKYTLQSFDAQSRISSSLAKNRIVSNTDNTPQHYQNIQQYYQEPRIQTMPDDLKYGGSQIADTVDKRMQEYLGVIFKKLQNDTDKIIKQISHTKKQKNTTTLTQSITQSKNAYIPNTSFIKRLKMNTLKLRLKKQRTNNCQSVMDKKVDYSINEAHCILEKLRKTQQFMNTTKNKLGQVRSTEKFNKTQKTDHLVIKTSSSLPKKYKY